MVLSTIQKLLILSLLQDVIVFQKRSGHIWGLLNCLRSEEVDVFVGKKKWVRSEPMCNGFLDLEAVFMSFKNIVAKIAPKLTLLSSLSWNSSIRCLTS